MNRRPVPYAAQWAVFTVFGLVLAGGALFQAHSSSMIVAVAGQAVVVTGMFIAGFCYRERLRQLDRQPRWRAFRRMLH